MAAVLPVLAAVGSAAGSAAGAVGSAAGAAGSALASGAGAVGSALGSAASAVGSAASEAGSAIGGLFSGGSSGPMSMLTGLLGPKGGGGGGGSAPTVPEPLGSTSLSSPDLSGLAAKMNRQMDEASVVTPTNETQALLRGGLRYGLGAISGAMGGKTGGGALAPTGGAMGWMNLPEGAGYGQTQQVGGAPGRSYPVTGGYTVGAPQGLGALY